MNYSRRFNALHSAVLGLLLTMALHGAAWATMVPSGTYLYDATFSESDAGFISFDGTGFVTPTDPNALTDTLLFELTSGAGTWNAPFADAVFSISSGFAVQSTVVIDLDNNGVDSGDSISSQLGPGSFSFKDSDEKVIVVGSFNSATFAADHSGNSGGIISSIGGGLTLAPGPGFSFHNTFTQQLLNPEGFSLILTGIDDTGVTTSASSPLFDNNQQPASVFRATLDPFSLSQGTVMYSGTVVVVPEPQAWILSCVGALICLACVRWPRCCSIGRIAAGCFTWLAFLPVFVWRRTIPLTTRATLHFEMLIVWITLGSIVMPALGESFEQIGTPTTSVDFELLVSHRNVNEHVSADSHWLGNLTMSVEGANGIESSSADAWITSFANMQNDSPQTSLQNLSKGPWSIISCLDSAARSVCVTLSEPWPLVVNYDPSAIEPKGATEEITSTITRLDADGQIEIRPTRMAERKSAITEWINSRNVW